MEDKKTYKSKWTTIMIIFLMGVGVGYFGNLTLNKGENTFAAGWNAAEQRLVDNDYMPSRDHEIAYMRGTILEIQNGKLKIQGRSHSLLSAVQNPIIIVNITDDTKILKLTERNREQYEKEYSEYFSKMFSGEALEIDPPEFFIKEQTSINSLEVGQYIIVHTKEDVREKNTIDAVTIELR